MDRYRKLWSCWSSFVVNEFCEKYSFVRVLIYTVCVLICLICVVDIPSPCYVTLWGPSQCYFTTGGLLPISLSWRQALRDSRSAIFFFPAEHFRSSSLCNIVCDERTGLSFKIVAGPRQCSHSQVPVQWDSLPYYIVSDSGLPQPVEPGPRIYIPQEQGGPICTVKPVLTEDLCVVQMKEFSITCCICEMYTWRKARNIHKRQTNLLVREDVT
jgi:hypothetical protein